MDGRTEGHQLVGVLKCVASGGYRKCHVGVCVGAELVHKCINLLEHLIFNLLEYQIYIFCTLL